ncbi:hypothetical protein [Shinella sp. JR1-6]|uniref:hypothetical protein n=1 Tax=Shinella sp. JR1-6 TaxID=2527671 RepID=UPI00102D4C3C|nr:hypothetical protein [Shinella sp. JR1-6]TAA54605.1 hypothetical protein EXZ48_26635 [Shinella sp. JR1-6]
MARPDPDAPLPTAGLSLDFNKANFIWFKYRDPYDDGFFLSYLAAERLFRAFFYTCPAGGDAGDTTIRYASDDQCDELRAMLSPEQVAMCVNASLRRIG